MNRIALIKYITLFITLLISICFLFDSKVIISIFSGLISISLLLAVTVFMFINMKKIKKYKFIYDVILMLLMIASTGIYLYIIVAVVSCFFASNCSMEAASIFVLIYPTLLLILLFLGFRDPFNETNKINDILVIAISVLIILIYMRYYLEPNFMHKLWISDEYKEYTYDYVKQNYIYFSIMYFLTLLHRLINK